MIGKYDVNPLLELRDSLKNAIKSYLYGHNINTPVEPVAKAILANNGCKFHPDGAAYSSTTIMNGEYGLYFVACAIGNDVNDCFDFINLNGMDYLVIFLGSFNGIDTKPDSNDEVALNADLFMGKQVYFDTICKIVNIFLATTTNPAVFTNQLATSAAARNYRFAPAIIAASIINDICGRFDENDASGIDYDFINDIIVNNKINMALCGIYKY